MEGSQIFLISESLVANATFLGKELGYQNSKASVTRDFFLDTHLVARLIGFIIKLMVLLKKCMMWSLMKLKAHMKKKITLMM